MTRVLLIGGCAIGILLFTCVSGVAQCRGNLDFDRDVDGVDLASFMRDFSQIDCGPGPPCRGDIHPVGAPDRVVDEFDLAEFIVDFGGDDCPLPVPANLFNIGDSIGEGEAANGAFLTIHRDKVWSTGYDATDVVTSFNERFEGMDPVGYDENNSSTTDATFNVALRGSEMVDFPGQAAAVVAAAEFTPAGMAGMITILLGANDVCADSPLDMTPPGEFAEYYRAGLDALNASEYTRLAHIQISSIPAIYWLWNAKRGDGLCDFIWGLFDICQNLLFEPDNDCASGGSHLDPDNINTGDGPDCIRRKELHAQIHADYNSILRDELLQAQIDGKLPNARYVNIYDVEFYDDHVNNGDCFHPSIEGQALLAEEEWLETPWGSE